MTTAPDHFERLPIHPRPNPLESLTSYLMRLAEANGITTVGKLSALLFGGHLSGMRRVRQDFPPLSFEDLPTLTGCSEVALFFTTFYYLGEKFGRPHRRQSAARFLKGSLAPNLRYCPQCLAERQFYSLAWRFLTLPGCLDHGGRLLDRCGHCGQAVPCLGTTLKLGYCPACGRDLRACRAERVSDAEISQSKLRYRDLCFLLSPSPGDFTDSAQGERLRRRFAHWRQARHASLTECSRELGEKFVRVWSIEEGDRRSGSTFLTYVRYADFLGLSLFEIFQTPLEKEFEVQSAVGPDGERKSRRRQLNEDQTLERLKQAAEQLRSLGKPVSQKRVSNIIGTSRGALKAYPRIKALLVEFTEEWRSDRRMRYERREDELIQQIDDAVAHLQQSGIRITQPAIAAALGRPLASLVRYPRVIERLKRASAERFYDGVMRDPGRARELIALVEQAVETLRCKKEPITYRAIANWVGISSQGLKRYPDVRQLLQRKVDWRDPRNDAAPPKDALVEQAQSAIREMNALGLPLTQKGICQKIGRSVTFLWKYPKVREIMLRAAAECSPRCARKGQALEDELLAQVNQAIDHLRSSHQPVTQNAVCRLIGEWYMRLRYYPRVRELLDQAMERGHRESPERTWQQEDKVMAEVQETIDALRAARKPLTQRAICQRMRVSIQFLMKYPRVRTMLRQKVRERRPDNTLRAHYREDELLDRVETAIHYFRSRRQPVTQRAIGKRVGMTPTGLRNYPRVRALLETVSPRHAASQDGKA